MYRAGLKQRRRRRWPIWTALLLVLVLIGGVLWVPKHLSAHTQITQSKAVVTTVVADDGAKKTFDETDFSFKLPIDWVKLPAVPSQYHMYRYSSGGKTAGMQVMEVYEDTIPAKYAVNNMVVVQGGGTGIAVEGEVSDNCAQFTKDATSTNNDGILAKWQGVDFLCDLGNQSRNVAGTSSLGNLNSVAVKSTTGIEHKFFFSYTDSGINPKFSVFVAALNSFGMK
ncbi:MAG: hypothetical protein JWN38_733 [Candidatus Saccharibacteria bacterium]|nr:hypothetical protein [Candidatus Saccharibacteria bacterium]